MLLCIWICYSVSTTVYLLLCIWIHYRDSVSTTIYLLLCICCCVSATVFLLLYIWISNSVSATAVYYCCVFAAVYLPPIHCYIYASCAYPWLYICRCVLIFGSTAVYVPLCIRYCSIGFCMWKFLRVGKYHRQPVRILFAGVCQELTNENAS